MAKRMFVVLLFCIGPTSLAADQESKDRGSATAQFPRNYFLRSLASDQPLVWQNAIERLEREYAGSSDAAQVLLAVLNRIDTDPKKRDVAHRLIRTLRLFEQREVSTYLIELLETPDDRLAMLSLVILNERDTELPAPIFRSLSRRKEFRSLYGFRLAVLQAAVGAIDAQRIDAQRIEFLIDILAELDGQSAAFVIGHLSRVSGQDFGDDQTQWQRWWKRVDRQTLRYERMAEGDVDPAKEDKYSSPEFFGIDIRAKRVVFIVDKSTSMSDPLHHTQPGDSRLGREPVESRLQTAQSELVSAIKSLPAETRFSILAFDGRVTPWRTELVPANPTNKMHAFRFVSSIAADGHTAWFDALDAAFQLDGNLESVYFLSDGVPTVGRIVSAPEIVRAITRENSFRRIAIHTIGLGVSQPADRFLSTLAQQNNGVYRSLGKRWPPPESSGRRQGNVAKFDPQRVIPRPMPPITRVRAMSAKSVNRRLQPNEAVLGVEVGDQARAYPINMLTGPSREIINDVLAGRAIAATW